MLIKSLEYYEHESTPQEWSINDFTLGNKNLIVGKNASGKSRSISIIWSLARNIAGLDGVKLSGNYNAVFIENSNEYNYSLHCKNGEVVSEKLSINGKSVLDRGEGGIGSIFAEKINNGDYIPFQSPTSTFAVFSRRDEIQHSFLEPLFNWASSVRFYPFSSYLGKEQIVILLPNALQVDERDPFAVVGLFRKAKKDFGEKFINAIKSDLASMGYEIDNIDVAAPISVQFSGMPGEAVGLFVKESNLPGITDQFSMSTGMFRALALIIHTNYFQLMKTASTVLIDDIGEGLDYERVCLLLDLLRKKADESDLQIIMSTNDSFVMNNVPLDEWSIIVREGNHINVKNYFNSKDKFEEFKFTGLSNFSFFELDVINE